MTEGEVISEWHLDMTLWTPWIPHNGKRECPLKKGFYIMLEIDGHHVGHGVLMSDDVEDWARVSRYRFRPSKSFAELTMMALCPSPKINA